MQTILQKPSLKILLADDDTDDRFFFEKALSELSLNTHLTTVHGGEQLMDYLLKNTENLPDVLFLDLSMPRKNGIECLSEIKENKQLEALPVIMFSTSFPRDNHYEQSLIQMLLGLGAGDFIRKPSGFAALKAVIQASLSKFMAHNTPSV